MPSEITVRDINPQSFIKEYALHLKNSGQIDLPKWVDIVKTGVSRQLPPSDQDWFYVRVAALSRHIYLNPNAGVHGLSKFYGSKKNNGHRPGKHVNSSRNIIRKALQALEKAGIVAAGSEKGRVISEKGKRELDQIAILCSKKY